MDKTKKKPKKEVVKSTKEGIVEMLLVNSHAAGIDVGATEHVVAVPLESLPKDSKGQRVRTFGTMTCHLLQIVAFLKECKILTVAMESTGVYWKPLFSLLSEEGFEVLLVNSKHVKNVTGRKTDEDDAMWIQKLHSCGLLRSSYLPEHEQEVLRTLVRFRKTLTADASRFINRIQKSLELMNIKFHSVIRDITGKSGLAVLEAILEGERDPAKFLPFIDPRVKASHDKICQSLEGNWQEEHLFVLRESFGFYKFYQARMFECDSKIEAQLLKYEAACNSGEIQTSEAYQQKHKASKSPKEKSGKKDQRINRKRKNKNDPKFGVRKYLDRIFGTDVLAIYGLNELGGLMLLSEVGTNMKMWESPAHFISWLNLCPNNKISGGKQISSRLMRKKPGLASQAFRHAANAVARSENWIGDYFRRIKAHKGHNHAIVATANKIATVFYLMVSRKEEFRDVDMTEYQQKHTLSKIAYLEKKLTQLKQQVA